jgi:hypothetical protein
MSETNTVSPLRQHMIEDMAARKLNPHRQRSYMHSCKRFAAWLKTLARYGNVRRGTPISAAPHRERYEHLQPQHATSPRAGGRGLAHQGAAEAAAGAEPGEIKRVLTMAAHHRDRHQHTIPIALAALRGAILPATSCLGAFRTPAAAARG